MQPNVPSNPASMILDDVEKGRDSEWGFSEDLRVLEVGKRGIEVDPFKETTESLFEVDIFLRKRKMKRKSKGSAGTSPF